MVQITITMATKIALVLALPAGLCKVMVTFLPLASMKRCPIAALNHAIGSSCLLEMTFVYLARAEASDGDDAGP